MSKKLLLMFLFVGAVAFTTTACGDKKDDMPEWEWPDPTPTPTPKPDDDVIKPRFVWIDAASNFHDYANDKAKIESDMAKVAQVGFTDIVVDVRPTSGDVLFRTTHTPSRLQNLHRGMEVPTTGRSALQLGTIWTPSLRQATRWAFVYTPASILW